MTTRTTMTRTIRLAIGTAAVLALMSQAAQARPISQQGGSASESPTRLVQKGTYMPVLPASPDAKVVRALGHASLNVPVGPARGQLTQLTPPTQTVTAKTSTTGFDWFAAAIGAASVLALVLIGAAALTARGRRHVPLSA